MVHNKFFFVLGVVYNSFLVFVVMGGCLFFVILVCVGLFYIWEFLEMVTRYSGCCIDGGGLYGGGLWMGLFVWRYLFDTSL